MCCEKKICYLTYRMTGQWSKIITLLDDRHEIRRPKAFYLSIKCHCEFSFVSLAVLILMVSFSFFQVISHKSYESREAFDREVDNALQASDVELVCLAGFMRILSGNFCYDD